MIQSWLGVKFRNLSWLERVWLGTPVTLWFSYQPLMRFAQDSTAYYELSIALLYVALLALVGLPAIWRAKTSLLKHRAVWLVGAFVGFVAVTLFWTPSLTRGVLTFGVMALLFLIFLAALAEQARLKKLLPSITKVLVSSAVVVSVLAFVQMFVGIWLPRNETLLCVGCIADQFGFARPNVFAIEPQFLGSLLLAPLLVLLQMLLQGRHEKAVLASFLLVSSALFLTLSRGAIYAFLLSAVFLFLLNWRAPRKLVQPFILLVISLLLALSVQGVAAALNPRVNVTFYGAVSASVNQLSLGLITLPTEQAPVVVQSEEAPSFEGYVPESTETRLSLSQLALSTWSTSASRMLFGVGLGGSGVVVHETYPDKVGTREIVQNEYAASLLEYGIIGLTLFVGLLVGFFYGTRKIQWVWAFALAYVVQWCFFSGYPNALHIYLVLIALYSVFSVRRSSN